MVALGFVLCAERTQSWLLIPKRRLWGKALPWQAESLPEPAKPPRPNEKFSRDDIRRIKESGPTLEDTQVTLTTYERDDTSENIKCVLALTSRSRDWRNCAPCKIKLVEKGI
jgi:hypothetical protein